MSVLRYIQMARRRILLVAILTILPLTGLGAESSIGVNWGNIASAPMNPSIVVGMLKDNKINKVKIFDADSSTLNALAGTGIEVMVGIPNNMLDSLSKDYDQAEDWVKENVTAHLRDQGGVDIKYVAVGNEPFLTSYNGSFAKITFPAFKNIQKALNEAGIGNKIKATIPQNAEVYESPDNMPSSGNFRGDIRQSMIEIVKYFHENGNPFVVNIYPFLSLYLSSDFPEDFAFFEGDGKPVRDKGKTYKNVFDANYDTLVWALKKAGINNMKIIVGEVGWPTDGHYYANATLAHKFYAGLMKKLHKDEGTPLRPGKLEVYLFGLLDEDMKSIDPGPFERHWGIFRYDGKPKFELDLTGEGRKTMPSSAKGVVYMDKQWCVVNNETFDKDKVLQDVNYACYHGDCTSLLYGSTCNKLDEMGNVSYAFNMYFQMQGQDVHACDFKGAAMIVKHNVSKGSCLFPIQIVSGSGRLVSFRFEGVAVAVAAVLSTLFTLF